MVKEFEEEVETENQAEADNEVATINKVETDVLWKANFVFNIY